MNSIAKTTKTAALLVLVTEKNRREGGGRTKAKVRHALVQVRPPWLTPWCWLQLKKCFFLQFDSKY